MDRSGYVASMQRALDEARGNQAHITSRAHRAAADVLDNPGPQVPWAKPKAQLAREIAGDARRQARLKPILAVADVLHAHLRQHAMPDAGLVRRLLVLRPDDVVIPVLRALRLASPSDSGLRLTQLLGEQDDGHDVASMRAAMKAEALQAIGAVAVSEQDRRQALAFAKALVARLVDASAPVRAASLLLARWTVRDAVTGFALLAARGGRDAQAQARVHAQAQAQLQAQLQVQVQLQAQLQAQMLAATCTEAEAASAEFLDAAYACIRDVTGAMDSRRKYKAAAAEAAAELALLRRLQADSTQRPGRTSAELTRTVASIDAGVRAASARQDASEAALRRLQETLGTSATVSLADARQAELQRVLARLARDVAAQWRHVAAQARAAWKSEAAAAFETDLRREHERDRARARTLGTLGPGPGPGVGADPSYKKRKSSDASDAEKRRNKAAKLKTKGLWAKANLQ